MVDRQMVERHMARRQNAKRQNTGRQNTHIVNYDKMHTGHKCKLCQTIHLALHLHKHQQHNYTTFFAPSADIVRQRHPLGSRGLLPSNECYGLHHAQQHVTFVMSHIPCPLSHVT